jgi:hypothetical protein
LRVEVRLEARISYPKRKPASQLAPGPSQRRRHGDPLAHPQEVRDTSAPRMGKALLLVTSVAFALALLELVVRAFVPVPFGTNAAHRFALDPELIYRLRPSSGALEHRRVHRDVANERARHARRRGGTEAPG